MVHPDRTELPGSTGTRRPGGSRRPPQA
jgi:hypothetical protein